jgi:hypothetical protein
LTFSGCVGKSVEGCENYWRRAEMSTLRLSMRWDNIKMLNGGHRISDPKASIDGEHSGSWEFYVMA